MTGHGPTPRGGHWNLRGTEQFRMVVNALQDASFVTNNWTTNLGNSIHNLNLRTSSMCQSLTTMEGQCTIQHGTLVGIPESVTQTTQGFREMNKGLGNLQHEIANSLQQNMPPMASNQEEYPDSFPYMILLLQEQPLPLPNHPQKRRKERIGCLANRASEYGCH